MKRIGMIIIAIGAMAAAAFAQTGPRNLAGPDEVAQPKQQQPLQQSIIGLFLSDFKNEVELTDEQFLSVDPIVRKFIEQRFRMANQKSVLDDRKNQLLSQESPAPGDLQQLNGELTKLDNQSGTWLTRFMANLKPQLSELQQVRARDFTNRFIYERLPTLIRTVRAPQVAPGRGAQPKPAMRANPNRPEVVPPGTPANTLRGNDVPVAPRRKLAR